MKWAKGKKDRRMNVWHDLVDWVAIHSKLLNLNKFSIFTGKEDLCSQN
jgi:hypothetical protein